MRDWLAHRTAATPTATALSVAAGPAAPDGREGGSTRTYRELNERVEELAGRLSALGVGVGTHLGVCLPTRPAFVELVHAAMRLGAVLVPLHARSTAPELAERARTADCGLVCCGAATEATVVAAADHARETDGDLPVATVDTPREGATRIDGATPETFDLPAWSPGRRLCLLFTSGTTGDPKVVDLRMGNVLASATASAFRLGLDPGDRWFDPLPMSHMGGLAPVYRSVCYGTTVTLPGPEGGGEGSDSGAEDVTDGEGTGDAAYSVGGFDPEVALAAMHGTGATCTSLVPTMLSRLLDAGSLPDSLRFVLLGGAPASDELLERCFDRGVPVAPTYGMTETASQIATARPPEARDHPGTVGYPLFTTNVTVIDSGTPVDPGERGELVVSGPAVTPSYYHDSGATERAFGPHGFHTGDVGYRDADGRVWVLNRLDDRLNPGGETVDPGEVVDVLRAFPGITEAAVVGLPDPEYGERVAALVVAADDVDPAALERHCRDRLSGFKLPRTVGVADSLPRTPSDTVDREAVRERLQTPDDGLNVLELGGHAAD
ncbi:class I adenylate-forming enzyme family protein [Haloglomus litoreum]|uniref:class I adenylate-forming enzyme family protein n=1 Tax=Haloglomus litoreum TaxID=3034026 RepID=UPI0023E81CC7|nr:AMP-binding protein [Haloglomus sp. DT116]